MLSILLSIFIVCLVWKFYKQKKFVNEQFEKAKKAQEKAIYGDKLPPKRISKRISTKTVNNRKKISS